MNLPETSSHTPTYTQDFATDSNVSWHVWCSVIAVISIACGVLWDLSWHKSIGRDTFWTAPHVLLYLGAVISAATSGALILRTTLDERSPLRAASIEVWGFRGPLGAFVCVWGSLAMLVSAPFDDWWHNAYGLDVRVLSPPHAVINLGMVVLRLGTVILIQVALNRASGLLRVRLQWLLLGCGMLLAETFYHFFGELLPRNQMHTAGFYRLIGITVPVGMVWIARASGMRFGNTILSAIGLFFGLVTTWIFPLFPAQPKLGPVFYPVTHMVPPREFPLLIIAGAFAMDLVWEYRPAWGAWRQATVGGTLFLAVFAMAQWPFATFLNSPMSANWFFATDQRAFFIPPDTDYARRVFTVVEFSRFHFWERMATAVVAAILSTRIGLALGNWMRTLRR